MRVFYVFVFLLYPMASAADLASCQRLYQNPPNSLLGMRLGSGKELERRVQGAGYELLYGPGSQKKLSLLFFDEGRRRVSDKVAFKSLYGQAEYALAQRRAAGLAKEGNMHLTDKNLPIQGSVAAAIFHVGATEKTLGNFYLMMGVVDNCMYKVIFAPSGNNRKADKTFYRLLDELALHLGAKS
jgi:catechol 2,3-dioxygenase-like lactoylglutathione lyase family enzyme